MTQSLSRAIKSVRIYDHARWSAIQSERASRAASPAIRKTFSFARAIAGDKSLQRGSEGYPFGGTKNWGNLPKWISRDSFRTITNKVMTPGANESVNC